MPTDGPHNFTSPGGRGRARCASKRERVRDYALSRSASPPPHPEAISRSLPTSPQRGEVKARRIPTSPPPIGERSA